MINIFESGKIDVLRKSQNIKIFFIFLVNVFGNVIIFRRKGQGIAPCHYKLASLKPQTKLITPCVLRTFALNVSAHPYCACKFKCLVIHGRAR